MKRLFSVVALALLTVLPIFASGYSEEDRDSQIRAVGRSVTEKRMLSAFKTLVLSGTGEIIYRASKTYSVTITADEALMNHIQSDVSGEKLTLSLEKGTYTNMKTQIHYIVEAPELGGLQIRGAGSFKAEDTLKNRNFIVDISGSGVVDTELNTDEIRITVSGNGNIQLSGSATSLDYTNSGMGTLDTLGLQLQRADVEINGTGNARLSVSDYLKVRIAGAGKVEYRGNPRLDYSASGSGNLIHLD